MTRTNDPRTATHLEVADGLAQATRLLQQLADAENEFSRQLKEVNGHFPLRDESLNKEQTISVLQRCIGVSIQRGAELSGTLDTISDQLATLAAALRLLNQ